MLYFNKELEQDNAQAQQLGHTAETEECNYSRSLAKLPFQTMVERVKFQRVSEDWHHNLEFQSALGAESCRAGHYAAVMAQQEKQAQERWSLLALIDLKPEFRRLTGNPAAEYRSRQEESL
jgi:hypothetical protein